MLTLVAWTVLRQWNKHNTESFQGIHTIYVFISCCLWAAQINSLDCLYICNLDLCSYFRVVGGCHLRILLGNRFVDVWLFLSGSQSDAWYKYKWPSKSDHFGEGGYSTNKYKILVGKWSPIKFGTTNCQVVRVLFCFFDHPDLKNWSTDGRDNLVPVV